MSLGTSTHAQGSQTGLSGRRTKPHRPESQQETRLSLRLPTKKGHIPQVFQDQHHYQKERSHHTPSKAAHSYPGQKQSFTNTAFAQHWETAWLKPAFDVARHSL